MADINDAVRARLAQAGLTEKHLAEEGTHIVGSDGDVMSVLVPAEQAKAVDTLSAELRDPTGKKLKAFEVQDGGELDLGELGKWHKFDVAGLASVERAAQLEEPPRLHLIGLKDGVAADRAFHTSLDLRLALYEILAEQELFVRPIPEGDRAGQEWVNVEPGQQELYRTLLRHYVDDTVPLATQLAAAERYRELQAKVWSTGLIGAAVLGAVPERPEVPASRVRGDEKQAVELEDKFGLGQETLAYLAAQNIELPPRNLTAKWLETTLDQVTDLADPPHDVVRTLRKKFAEQKQKVASSAASIFATPSTETAEAPKKEAPNPAKVRLERAEAVKLDRIEQAVGHLGVPEVELRRLARELALATEQRRFPSTFFFPGPRHSAAEKMMETVIELVGGKKPVVLDLSDPEFALAYGHYKGVPADADGLLSKPVLDRARGSAAAHVAIVVPDLMRVGSSPKDPAIQKASLVDWLKRLDEMMRTGTVEVCTRGSRSTRTSPLANVVFVAGCSDPAALAQILDENPELKPLATKIFGSGELRPDEGVANLERTLTFRLRQHMGPKGAQVAFSEPVREALTSLFHSLGSSAAHDLLERKLSDEVVQFAMGQPAAKYTLHWSGMLSARDVRKIGEGSLPAFADELFDIKVE